MPQTNKNAVDRRMRIKQTASNRKIYMRKAERNDQETKRKKKNAERRERETAAEGEIIFNYRLKKSFTFLAWHTIFSGLVKIGEVCVCVCARGGRRSQCAHW